MKLRKRNAFTLIELIATLVIMAILALIVTPLVMNIIRKARVSADKRSVDAYGRSIELAIAGYLLDTGSFPTSIEQLTIEYSGNKVECETTRINSDSSVYLAGCTVNSRSVEGYTYGKEETVSYKAYSIGDEVTYNNVDYYVIKDSGENESTVTLLKAEPLRVEEVNKYGGVGTENNHVNKYTNFNVGIAFDNNGTMPWGGMAYYTSEFCGYVNDTGCTNDYTKSEVKYVVDAWALDKVSTGLVEARLIDVNDLLSLGYIFQDNWYEKTPKVPEFINIVDSGGFSTMIPSLFSDENPFFVITNEGELSYYSVYTPQPLVRPVIVLDKSVL